MTGTERKVFQKYYPPDFDPSKIPKAKGGRNRQFVQRVMAPYNMQCNTCHEYIYKGKKFNMRRETAEGEFYLGLRIFRFYFRCPNCLAEITFKTDLEKCDYQQEHGATRLFEAFKLYQDQEKEKERKEEEDAKNPMKMLEKRTKLSRAEMEALGKLEELRELNRRHESVSFDSYINQPMMSEADAMRMQEERDEEFVQKLYGKKELAYVVKRLADDDGDAIDVKPNIADLACSSSSSGGGPMVGLPPSEKPPNKWLKSTSQSQTLRNAVVVKKRPKMTDTTTIPDKSSALLGLAAYGTSDSDSS